MSLNFTAQTSATLVDSEGNESIPSVVLKISEDTSYLEIESDDADIIKKDWTLIIPLKDLVAAISTLERLRKE